MSVAAWPHYKPPHNCGPVRKASEVVNKYTYTYIYMHLRNTYDIFQVWMAAEVVNIYTYTHICMHLHNTYDCPQVRMAAEVVNLARSVTITGDDFTGGITGLHTIMAGVGGSMRVEYTRVEKCGQRGVKGRCGL